MRFPSILASTRNLIRFAFIKPNVGDNALLTIKDHNTLVDKLNNIFTYRSVDLAFTQVGVANPFMIPAADGDGDCNDCIIQAAPSCSCTGGTVGGTKGLKASAVTFTGVMTRTGAGVYDLMLNPICESVINMKANGALLGVYVEALPNIGEEIRVDKSALVQNKITIKTYSAGVLTDGLLNQTLVHFRFYKDYK